MKAIPFLALLLAACSKGAEKAPATIKYEVSGTAPQYRVGYTSEAGTVQWALVPSGWTHEVRGKEGQCYQLSVIPYRYCDYAGSGNIYVGGTVKASRSVPHFGSTTTANEQGAQSCGFKIEACQ